MLRATRSAWVALRRPTVRVSTIVAAAAFAALSTALTFLNATDVATGDRAPGGNATRASLAQAGGVVAGLAEAGTFLGIVAVVLGASTVAADYQHGTLRTLLVRQPDRLRLLAGKLLAVWGLLFCAAAAATVVAACGALLLAGEAQVDSARWSVGEALAGGVEAAGAMAGFGLFGAVLGLLLRTPAAAIGIGVGWVLAVEQLLSSAWPDADDLLPGRLLAAVADGSAGAPQLVTALAWGVAAAVLAGLLVRRRDVTA